MEQFDHIEAAREIIAIEKAEGRRAAERHIARMAKDFNCVPFAEDLTANASELADVLNVLPSTLRWIADTLNSAVGKFANHIGYSDVHPYEIVREVSDKIIEVRAMKAERDPTWKPEMIPGGFAAHCTNQHEQRWIITSDESAPVIRLHLRKDGCFYRQGSKFRREAKPRRFYDYNF
ncbi:hypothetical protein [Pseudomonas phage Itty13]|uniref:Uncharacterized protein n=1 Tax=Pseudomonas phage Itty13 TaxID=2805750 RepID=A0A889IR09_9CAUD|nr:hypothetical protein PQC19_gp33 [Pseudomonas phage Itty13]QRE00609.1 hypothetical protein [Pseudomonas phage Itty13]